MNTQKLISWNGIFVGVIMSLAIVSLFNLLGVGLGFARLTGPVSTSIDINMGFLIWIILSSVVPLLCGGWLAAFLSNLTTKFDGVLHGLVTWALATLLSLLFVTTTTGMLFNGTANWLKNTVVAQQSNQQPPVSKTMQSVANESLTNFQQETAEQATNANKSAAKNAMTTSPQQLSEVVKNMTIITFLGFIISAFAGAIGGMFGVHTNAKTILKM